MLLRGTGKNGGTAATTGADRRGEDGQGPHPNGLRAVTPPAEFVDQYGKNPPKTSKDYLAKLLEKIRNGGKNIQEQPEV